MEYLQTVNNIQVVFIALLLFTILAIVFYYQQKIRTIKEKLQKELLNNILKGKERRDLYKIKVDNAGLTDREKEVLLKLGITSGGLQGLADALFVEVSTVKHHLGKIYKKLEVTGGTEAVPYAEALRDIEGVK